MDFAVRTSSLISSNPKETSFLCAGPPLKRCSTDPPPRDCDGEQHLEHLPRRSSGPRRVSAVYIGPPPVLKHDDGTIRVALDWERDEVFLQMLSWRDSAAMQ